MAEWTVAGDGDIGKNVKELGLLKTVKELGLGKFF